MEFQPQLILIYFNPVFTLFMATEFYLLRKQASTIPGSAQYSWKDTISNGFLALFHEIGDAIAAIAVISIYYSLFDFRPLDIPNSWWAILLLFVLQDFMYYWFHRASHRIRWMWASHVVHHSSEQLNFSTAFRQSFTYPISGMWVFWLPLIALGFEPMTVIAVVLFNLAYQFFLPNLIRYPEVRRWLQDKPDDPTPIMRLNGLLLMEWRRVVGCTGLCADSSGQYCLIDRQCRIA